jgi:predicted nuclease of predicted toxin-antitoxin system
MVEYLVDANLPYRFSIWNDHRYVHQADLGDSWTDNEIWDYARKNNLTIITKDSDFSERIMLSIPPPRVIHIRFGNMKMANMYRFLSTHWESILQLSSKKKLVNIYIDRITTVE